MFISVLPALAGAGVPFNLYGHGSSIFQELLFEHLSIVLSCEAGQRNGSRVDVGSRTCNSDTSDAYHSVLLIYRS
jgi:hypothetical protein